MTLIQFRRDTAANWASRNTVLAAGEFGFESDTKKFKIGAGNWNSLDYIDAPTVLAEIAHETIDADLDAREIGFVDIGGGEGYFTVGGVQISGTLVPPAATWSGVAGVPTITAYVTEGGAAADNSIAIATAISTAVSQNANVRIPAGTYNHQGFTPAAGVEIIGDGIGRTILTNTHATNASVTLHGSAEDDYLPGIRLRDMTLTTDGVRTGQAGLDLYLCRTLAASDLLIEDHGTGVLHDSAWALTYTGVRVDGCEIGWHFPDTGGVGSTPVTITGSHALRCTDTGVKIDNRLQTLLWSGGDIAANEVGILVNGTSTAYLTFAGINFESNVTDDIVIGTSGLPASINFSGCRFFRSSAGTNRSVNIAAGGPTNFIGCRWLNYAKAVYQGGSTSALILLGCSTSGVATYLDLNGTTYAYSPIITSRPGGTPVVGYTTDITATSTSILANKTLTSPVLTAPYFSTVMDVNGNKEMDFLATTSAVNYVRLKNAATGSSPFLQGTGTDTDVGLGLAATGTGQVSILNGDLTTGVKFDLSGITAGLKAVAFPNVDTTQLGVSTNGAPASAAATGVKGEVRIAGGYMYVCTATDTWVRASASSW